MKAAFLCLDYGASTLIWTEKLRSRTLDLMKPQAVYRLISELKEAVVDIPVHLHTHDTSGNGVLMYTKAIEAGVDIVDMALSTMVGLTSQPSANTLH